MSKVVYVTSALPTVTPVDLSTRATVAPPSEAKKCVFDGVLLTFLSIPRNHMYSQDYDYDTSNSRNTVDNVNNTTKFVGKTLPAVSDAKPGASFARMLSLPSKYYIRTSILFMHALTAAKPGVSAKPSPSPAKLAQAVRCV